MRIGQVFQFFHKDSESYLSAEGVYDDDFEDSESNSWLAEDIHLRHRKADIERPSRLRPPTSAVSFFQIEGK